MNPIGHPNAVRCKDCTRCPPRQFAKCHAAGKAVSLGAWRFCKKYLPIVTGAEAERIREASRLRARELIPAGISLPTSEGEMIRDQKETGGLNTGAAGIGKPESAVPSEYRTQPPTLADAGIDKPPSQAAIERIKAHTQWLIIQPCIIRLEAVGPASIGVQLRPGLSDFEKWMAYEAIGIGRRTGRSRPTGGHTQGKAKGKPAPPPASGGYAA